MRAYMVALGLLFLALGHPSFAQEGAGGGAGVAAGAGEPPAPPSGGEVYFDVRGKFPVLDCANITGFASTSGAFTWEVNGTAPENVSGLKGRYKLSNLDSAFTITEKTVEDDFGNYTCLVDKAVVYTYDVRGRTVARLGEDHSVVEGQMIKIKCRLVGKPYPEVQWTYRAAGAENASEVTAALGERVSFDKNDAGVEGAALVLALAQLSDAGNYSCAPLHRAAVPAYSTLRVKDMYAALWPFLGICVEVFILCAVILVYERRRTKPEHDDSDTDNHEQ